MLSELKQLTQRPHDRRYDRWGLVTGGVTGEGQAPLPSNKKGKTKRPPVAPEEVQVGY